MNIQSLNNNITNTDNWLKLFDFCFTHLKAPSTKMNLTKQIKYQLNNPIPNSNAFCSSRPNYNHNTPNLKAKLISRKINAYNIKAALNLAVSEDIISPDNLDTILLLQSIHPQDFNKLPPPPLSIPTPPLTVIEVTKAIVSFRKDSSGGLDGFRAIYLQDLTKSTTTSIELINNITTLLNHILNGNIPSTVQPLIHGARLIALNKKNGGIRPIALTERLIPHQLGFNIPSGCEAPSHATRIQLHSTKNCILKVDFKNAFNSLKREHFLPIFCDAFPEYSPYLFASYNNSSYLKFNNTIIESRQGIQQGDPLGPALFCLVLPSHQAFFLLKNFFFIPKIQHAFRSAPLFLYPEILTQIELTIKDSLEGIFDIKFSPNSWMQASLPSKFGGLGLRSSVSLSLAAFLASESSSRLIMLSLNNNRTDPHFLHALAIWKENSFSAPIPTSRKQHDWDLPLIRHSVEYLISSAASKGSPSILSHLLSPITVDESLTVDHLSLPQLQVPQLLPSLSGYEWLEAFPSSNLGLLLTNEELRIAIGLRLDCNILANSTCTLCFQPVDCFGHHPLHCRFSKGRHSRHSAVNGTILRALRSAQIPATLELCGLSTENNIRPDGLTLIPWSNGILLAWDYICIDRFAPSFNKNSFMGAENSKIIKYTSLTNCNLIPIVSDTTGSFGNHALTFFKTLGKKIRAITGDPQECFYLRQRISIDICRSNCIAIHGSLS
ncbi:uncharacterized protein LOC135927101 [Gordionus sp. m RMFG-2023]|uniref:uncharacterized protein LOC135927101 n=1 Tax=Gordionus sp. m RMFG-2023 TaxID=3053472 RepID=UPI0031FC930B